MVLSTVDKTGNSFTVNQLIAGVYRILTPGIALLVGDFVPPRQASREEKTKSNDEHPSKHRLFRAPGLGLARGLDPGPAAAVHLVDQRQHQG